MLTRNRCLPKSCETYKVKQSDTCLSVAKAVGLSYTMLLSYNPTLNRQCTNLFKDDQICLTPPAGRYRPVVIHRPLIKFVSSG